MSLLHLATLGNDNILSGSLSLGPCVLNFSDNVHAVCDLTKDDMFVVEEGGGNSSDEKLTAISVRSRVLSKGHLKLSKLYLPVYVVLTAMLSNPAESCFRLKFSSANERVP